MVRMWSSRACMQQGRQRVRVCMGPTDWEPTRCSIWSCSEGPVPTSLPKTPNQVQDYKTLTRRERLKSALYPRLKKRKVFKILIGGLFENPVCCKISKKKWRSDPLKTLKNFEKKSHKAEKGAGESVIAPKNWKGGPFWVLHFKVEAFGYVQNQVLSTFGKCE